MKPYEWSPEKSKQVKIRHGISFEEIVRRIKRSKHTITISHPNTKKYGHQRIILVEIKKYMWVIPCVIDEEKIFLKTAFPSRKYTKKYVKKGNKYYEKTI